MHFSRKKIKILEKEKEFFSKQKEVTDQYYNTILTFILDLILDTAINTEKSKKEELSDLINLVLTNKELSEFLNKKNFKRKLLRFYMEVGRNAKKD